MIFATGLGLFVIALFLSWSKRPEKAGTLLSLIGLSGLGLMLISVCMLIARFMP